MKIIKIKHSIFENICHFALLYMTTMCFLANPFWWLYELANIDTAPSVKLTIIALVTIALSIFLFSRFPLKSRRLIFYATIICNFLNTYDIPNAFYLYFFYQTHDKLSEEVRFVSYNARYIFLMPLPVYLTAYLNKKLFYTLAAISILTFIIAFFGPVYFF